MSGSQHWSSWSGQNKVTLNFSGKLPTLPCGPGAGFVTLIPGKWYDMQLPDAVEPRSFLLL
jgi:hypothetical protein